MTFPACVRQVLEEGVWQPQERDGSFILCEKGVMDVEVSQPAGDTVIVRLNRVGELKGMRPGRWRQVCDYLVIRQRGETVQVLFVELKLTLTEEVKGLEQLRRSLRFVQYLNAIHQVECGVERDAPEVRYALVAARQSARLDKQRLRADGGARRRWYEGIEVALHVVGKRVAWGRLWDG